MHLLKPKPVAQARAWRVLGAILLVTVLVLGFAKPAVAHDPGTSVIEVRPTQANDGQPVLETQLDLAIEELGSAIGKEIPLDAFGLSQVRDDIVNYTNEHLSVLDSGESAESWSMVIGQLRVIRSDGRQYVRAAISFTSPDSSSEEMIDRFVVRSDVIVESDDSHQLVVTVIQDDGTVALSGVLDADSDELAVSLSGDEVDAAFTAIIRHGFDHVLEGADHLLFLLTLLLPAPLIAANRRWESAPGLWRGFKRVVHVATAFTIGHSISLALTALGFISVPSKPVEIAIAVSVAVSALHALRPLTTRGEVLIAAGFGLVHGVAFAEILTNYGLEGSNTLRTLLAFNLGVEAAQLITIAVAFPSLWLLSRTKAYPAVRIGGAGLAFLMAIGWVAERLDISSSPFGPIEDWSIDNLIPLGCGLAAVAVVAWIFVRSESGTASSPAPTTDLAR